MLPLSKFIEIKQQVEQAAYNGAKYLKVTPENKESLQLMTRYGDTFDWGYLYCKEGYDVVFIRVYGGGFTGKWINKNKK